jgi:acyl-CoA reductase-like NAD-dependent aldehyde dehydrogenase
VGQTLVDHPDVAGITFTGSYDVGMGIIRTFTTGKYPRPCVAEMGGKNPVIISNKADLDKAAMGVCAPPLACKVRNAPPVAHLRSQGRQRRLHG